MDPVVWLAGQASIQICGDDINILHYLHRQLYGHNRNLPAKSEIYLFINGTALTFIISYLAEEYLFSQQIIFIYKEAQAMLVAV